MSTYLPQNGSITGRDLPLYSNRPIYEANTSAWILAGDRPLMRLGFQRCLLGTLRLFIGGKALDEFPHADMVYSPGRVDWTVRDEYGAPIELTVTSPGEGIGLVLRAVSPMPLAFSFGGVAHKDPDPGREAHECWNLSPVAADRSLTTGAFDPVWLEGNEAGFEDGVCFVRNPDVDRRLGRPMPVYVRSDLSCAPEGCLLRGETRSYLLIQPETSSGDPKALFEAGLARGERLKAELAVTTPDPALNAACRAAAAEMDGVWHPPKTMHGNMSWNMPLVGWLVHGHHVLGHHDRAKATLRAYAEAQIKEDGLRGAGRTPEGCLPDENSRFYGQGYISQDQTFYNMQTQFFHQMIQAWRYSGDGELAALLRDALRLHIRREDECFDPDGDGLYESVLNTWPTDSVFTGGGGALEETCYMYAACAAMAELTEGEEREIYKSKAEKIRGAFFEKLWIPEKGYPGAYVEWGGHRRLHEDAWLYSSFLPAECGLLDEFQTAQALHYPEWALEKDENGLYWYSNWTPGIWSVRECAPGENMQQAIACLKGGHIEQGLSVLLGLARRCLNGPVPGDLTNPTVEAAMQLARCAVEGLFGYQPDYPNGRVTIAPKMPMDWESAALSTADVTIEYRRNALRVRLTRPARLTLRLRLYAEELVSIRGADRWKLVPAIGGMVVEMDMGECAEADVEMAVRGQRDFEKPAKVSRLPTENLFDPQNAASASWGEHAAFERTAQGWWRELHLDLGPDPARRELVEKQRAPIPEKAEMLPLDIRASLNADVRAIFRQKYLSPRPHAGTPAEIGFDGFTLWTFPFWGIAPPELSLEKTGLVQSPSGVPVRIEPGDANIAFVSLWDNYPTRVTLPVRGRARMAALAVAGSTNPMQCGIENARVTFRYGDGSEEVLPLVNPQNYIQLCPYPPRAATAGFPERADVFNPWDEPLLKDFTPEVLPLGENLRALLIRWPLKGGAELTSIGLEAMSPDVVAGILAVTLIV